MIQQLWGKKLILKSACILMSTVVLLTIAKVCNQPMNEQRCGKYTQWNTIQPKQIIKFCHLQQHWTDLEGTVLSE